MNGLGTRHKTMRRQLCALWLCLTALELVPALKFNHVTREVGLRGVTGQITAYADFNADKTTDVLILSQNNSTKSHSIYLWSSSDRKFKQNGIKLDVPSPVAEVSVADFDGDGIVDILTLSAEGGNDGACFTATVHWCSVTHEKIVVDDGNSTTVARNVRLHPLLIDSNGDHVPDILLVSCKDDSTSIWSCQEESRGFTETLLGTDQDHKVTITSSHYVDINSDCLADIIFVGDYKGVKTLEVWLKVAQASKFVYHQTMALPSPLREAAIVGELAFADVDGDAILEAIVFSCGDKSCDKSFVHILYQQKFHGTNVFHCKASGSWKMNFTSDHVISVSFDPGHLSPQDIENHTPILGDVNLDGHPDVITMATYIQEGPQPLLLLSTHCKSHCNGSAVTLQPRWDTFNHLTNVTSASFFDVEEDGILDVLVAQQTSRGSKLQAYQQSLTEDNAFLKVLVVSGHCFYSCLSGREPYGSVLPGAVVAFSTTDINGKKKKSVAVTHQGSTLQLPFIVFGLGETPNFIQDLTVGAAHRRGASYHQWTSLIPNSQIIVITRPPNNAKNWQLELYLTPSHLVYSTAGVLCALFVGVAILVALLHARERYIDSRERKQAKHRFHFNAM